MWTADRLELATLDGPAERDLLRCASVVGVEFSVEAHARPIPRGCGPLAAARPPPRRRPFRCRGGLTWAWAGVVGEPLDAGRRIQHVPGHRVPAGARGAQLLVKDEPELPQPCQVAAHRVLGEVATAVSRRIDYILIRCGAHGPTLQVRSCDLLLDDAVDEVWASDHFGVVADLSLPDHAPGSWGRVQS